MRRIPIQCLPLIVALVVTGSLSAVAFAADDTGSSSLTTTIVKKIPCGDATKYWIAGKCVAKVTVDSCGTSGGTYSAQPRAAANSAATCVKVCAPGQTLDLTTIKAATANSASVVGTCK